MQHFTNYFVNNRQNKLPYATIMRGGGFNFMKKGFVAVFFALALAACNDEQNIDLQQSKQIIEEGTVGFEIAGGTIEEASGVSAEEKQQLVEAFEEYIDAFNAKDIERYAATLSKNPKGFNYEEDKKAAHNIERLATDITIVKFLGEEAHVYANLAIKTVEIATGAELSSKGRQVTVFVKEDGGWKVSSVYYIGNE